MSETGQPHHPVHGTAPFRRHAAELDLFEGTHPARLRRVVLILALATVFAAMLNSGAIVNWAIELPFWLGIMRDGIVAAANTWDQWMTGLGCDQVHAAVREAFRWLQFWQPGGPPA